MDSIKITQDEIVRLKPTMGFRINMEKWNNFANDHPDGCSGSELIEFVKKWMNPPYTEADLDGYLNSILVLFLNFIRS